MPGAFGLNRTPPFSQTGGSARSPAQRLRCVFAPCFAARFWIGIMPRKVKGFSRVDSGDAHGWLVRIKRGDVKRSRFISDSTHGGKRKSQRIAQKVYQEWADELPAPATAEDKLGKRNASGVVGVHYSHDVDARYPNCAYEYYIASWKTEAGRRRNVRFSINRWGKRAAFKMACIARRERISDRAEVQRLYETENGRGARTPAGGASSKQPKRRLTASAAETRKFARVKASAKFQSAGAKSSGSAASSLPRKSK